MRKITEVRADTPTLVALRERRNSRSSRRYLAVKLPFDFIERAERARGLYLFLCLLTEHRLTRRPTRLGADLLSLWGLSRHVVYRTLRRLELEGLVDVDRQPGRACRVTVLTTDAPSDESH